MPVNTNLQQTIAGARAILSINGKQVGIFSSCSVSYGYTADPIYILGRYSPAEIIYTSAVPAQADCSGWRVYDNTVHTAAAFPLLKDLPTHTAAKLIVADRQHSGNGSSPFISIVGIRPTSYRQTMTARQTVDIAVSYVGTIMVDEKNPEDDEAGGASVFPV